MAYGAQIFINGTSFDVVSALAPTYVLDIVTGNSGSKSYSIPPTTTLTAKGLINAPDSNFNPSITISGGTVTWSGLGGGTLIIYGN